MGESKAPLKAVGGIIEKRCWLYEREKGSSMIYGS